MFVRLLTIACLFSGFYLLNCGPLPPPPPGPENAFVALEFKNSRGEITKNVMTDSTGKQIKIYLIHNLTQYIDSAVLRITNGSDYKDSLSIRSFKSQLDTTIYPLVFSAAGTYSVSFTGYIDGQLKTLDGTITIYDRSTSNQKPVLNLPKVESAVVNRELVFSISATDPDVNQQVLINILKKPDNATFAENQFKWTPALSDTGTVTLIFTAADNGSPVITVTDSLKFIVTATPVNRAPTWNPSKMQRTIVPSVLFSLDISPYCSDPDNDSLTFSLKSESPVKDTIVGKVYQFTPSVSDTGKYSIHIIAADPLKLVDSFTLELTVSNSASATEDKVPPVILFKSPSKDTIISVDSCEIKVTCIDDSGCSVKGFRDGTPFDLKKSATVANLWTGMVKGLTAGNYSVIKIVATDSSKAKNTNSDSVRIKWTKKVSFALTIAATNGSVNRSPDASVYDSGVVVSLVPVPADNYHFSGWSGALSGTANPTTITMNSAKSVTALFEANPPNTFSLTVLSENGTVIRSPNAASYDSGAVVSLTATPAIGYQFTGWSGGLTGTTNPSSITMNSAKSVTANFAIRTYALTITSTNGSVTKSPNASTYDSGTVVELTATPAAGYQFTGWGGGLTGATNPSSITMSSAKSVTANFAIKTYALTITSTNGSVTKSPNASTYDSGTVVELTATPAAGYQFTGWSGGLSGTTNPASITMNSANSVTANFDIKTYALTITSANGSVTKSPNATSYDSGTVVTLTATPASGYQFTGWSGGLSGTTNPSSITMNSVKSVTANFVIKTYALNITSTNGSVAKSPNATSYDSGTVVTLTATPASGFQFTGWSGGLTGTINPTSITMNSVKNVTANFTAITYKITYDRNNGTGTAPTDNNSYTSGSLATILPNSGALVNGTSSFAGWSTTNGTTYVCGQQIPVTGNLTLYAVYSDSKVMDNDGNEYDVLLLGNVKWLKQNLKTTKYRNGSSITFAKDSVSWVNRNSGTYCWQEYDISNKVYGALYDWAAVQAGQVAPAGWRIPTEAEWTNLFDLYERNGCAYITEGTTYWLSSHTQCGSQINTSGFSAMGNGYMPSSGIPWDFGSSALWWVAGGKCALIMYGLGWALNVDIHYDDNIGVGIRCVKE